MDALVGTGTGLDGVAHTALVTVVEQEVRLALPCLALPCLALPCLALPCRASPLHGHCLALPLHSHCMWRKSICSRAHPTPPHPPPHPHPPPPTYLAPS